MKTNKNKSRVDIYTTMYNVDLIVANRHTTLEQLQQDYCYSDGVELDSNILDGCSTCSTVKNKKTDRFCILIKDNHSLREKGIDKFLDLIDSIAHEAMHALIDIYESINAKVTFDNPEPTCYFMGYICKCTAKTLFNR